MVDIPISATQAFQSKGWALLSELFTAFGGHVMGRILFDDWGKTGDKELIKNAVALIKEGKKDEARDLLHARPGGLGMADEEILFSDMLAIRAGGMVSDTESQALAEWLANLTPEERRKFRLAHIKQPDYTPRYRKLVTLAKMPDNDARLQFARAAGMFDPSAIDGILRQISVLDAEAAGRNLQLDVEAKQKMAQIRGSVTRDERRKCWNPFR